MTSQASPTSSSSTSLAVHKQDDSHDDIPNLLDPNRWYFAKEQLETTPSRKGGIDADKELTYRQQSANFIQDMGQRLQVNQLCINTAIVYMHRFYMYHSFSQFHRNQVSTASIFLAAKVEEQPRKLEHVIKVAHYCLSRDNQPIDVKSEAYMEQTSELVITENILLQTLGFDVAIDHPHTHVVKCCQLVRASKDLAQTSYFMATNSLHLTTMCLQYKPTVVACVCIHLTCKWSNWEIPRSKEGRDWFWYVDQTVSMDQLEKLTTEFLAIFDKFPSRLKKKIMSLNQGGGSSASLTSYPNNFNLEPGSPGTPHYPVNRHSPGMAAGMFGNTGSSSLGKRPSSSVKPSGAQVNSKQGKMIVNGGMAGHHPSKQPSSSSTSSSHGPQIPSSSKHYPSGSKIPPPHHSSKDSQQTQKGQVGHPHHSSGTHGSYHGQNRPSSSSQSHPPSGHHTSSSSSSLHPPPSSSGQPNKISSHPPGMVGSQHTSSSKSQHNQPSKPPPNFNIKSQQPQQQPSSSSSMPQGHPMKSSSTVNPVSHVNKVQAALPSGGLPPPPPQQQQQQQQQSQLPFNQIKKQPYQETLRRSTGTTSSTNSNNLTNNNNSSSNHHHQQQQQQHQHNSTNNIHSISNTSTNVGVSKTNVSVPFNSNTITDTIITTTTTTPSTIATSSLSSASSRPWGESVPLGEPRLPTGRTSSLFSPEIPETSIPPIQPFLKNEVLSPIGGDVGANSNSKGNGVGDFLGENNLYNSSSNNNSNPPMTATLFPNLTQFDYGVGVRSNNNNNNNSSIGVSENSLTLGIKTIKTEDSGVVIGNINNNKSSNNNNNNSSSSSSNLHGRPEMMMNDGLNQPASNINALSSMTMPAMTTSNNGNSNNSSIIPSSLDVSLATTSSTYLPQMDIDNTSRIESSHKKSKKNKKEKHKHKDKDKEKKDKESKKHKDKDKEKNKEEKKHKDKEKEKHKKDKHRDKEKPMIKYENPMMMDSSPPPSSSFLPPPSASGYPENRIKMTISKVENVHHHESHEKSASKSKHSSKKSSKSKSSDSMATTITPTTIPKIKIAPVRPPSNDVYMSKPN